MSKDDAAREPEDTATHNQGVPSRAPYERVIGRYALCAPFAQGGMATVHLARQVSDEGFSRVVAVKRLHAHVAESNESLAMFLDEARLASRIRHSNVVPTLDVVSRDGELLIVMEYVLGDSLSGLIRATHASGKRVPIPIAVRIAIDMLHGLHAAHEARDEEGQPLGIVHRDVSPQNVLVGVDGVPRIVDFGIAKAAGRLQTTQNNKLKGKLAYMAPEQLERQGALDRRVDVYAVSIVLWEMLTMQRLFRGEDEIETFKQALSKEIPKPSSLNPEVSPELEHAVMHGLTRNRDARASTARELANELEELRIAATTATLADWVAETADSNLGAARERFSALEKAPPPDPSAMREPLGSWSDGSVRAMVQDSFAKSEAPTDVIEAETGSPITVTGVEPPPPRRRGVFFLLAAILGGVALGTFLGFRGDDAPTGEPAVSPQVEERREKESVPAVEKQPEAPEPAAVQEEEPKVKEPEPMESEAREHAADKPSAPPPQPKVRPRPRPKSKPKDDCSNPFTVDKDGVRIPKVHCL